MNNEKLETYAFDYETFYSKEYTIRTLGNWAYVNHPEFDAYMLSVVGTDGFEWVGNPKDFDWERISGHYLVAHNAGFEQAVTERLRVMRVVPKDFHWAGLYDTADLAAYLGVPRNLASACEALLGITVDKGMRDKAKGKRWSDMDGPFQKAMTEYALTDSKLELQLWTTHSDKWPEWERKLSAMTLAMCWKGLPSDRAATQKGIKILEKRLLNARHAIPWADDPEAPVLSLAKAAVEARKHNVIPPKSFAKDSAEFDAWLEKYETQFPWARALGEYRSVNMLMKKLMTLDTRTDDNGVFRYGLKYFGGHTGRDSGDSGFNPQNLPRETMFGVDTRACTITAPDGYILGVTDSKAIEPRILSVIAGDDEYVAKLREGMDPYEARARVAHGYDDPRPLGEVDPKRRQKMKVEVLMLGYGAGAEKTQSKAKKDGIDLTFEEAEALVIGFRKRKFIPNLWKELEGYMKKSAPGDYEMELPSGRVMKYREVRTFGSVSAIIPRLNKMMRIKFWGGHLVENACQAIARDVFMWQMIQATDAGIDVLLRNHDEAVTLHKEDKAEEEMKLLSEIMHTAPPWMQDLPVAAEGILTKVYKKP